MMINTLSSKGKKARPPAWWSRLVGNVPKIYLPWLRPAEWNEELARKWVNSIPSKCPFERQWWVGDTLVLFIPALCPLNPLSTQLYSIRIEAQTYLSWLEEQKQEK